MSVNAREHELALPLSRFGGGNDDDDESTVEHNDDK